METTCLQTKRYISLIKSDLWLVKKAPYLLTLNHFKVIFTYCKPSRIQFIVAAPPSCNAVADEFHVKTLRITNSGSVNLGENFVTESLALKFI